MKEITIKCDLCGGLVPEDGGDTLKANLGRVQRTPLSPDRGIIAFQVIVAAQKDSEQDEPDLDLCLDCITSMARECLDKPTARRVRKKRRPIYNPETE